MGNDGHVPDVRRIVHQLTDLATILVPILRLMIVSPDGAGVVCVGRTSSTVKLVDY